MMRVSLFESLEKSETTKKIFLVFHRGSCTQCLWWVDIGWVLFASLFMNKQTLRVTEFVETEWARIRRRPTTHVSMFIDLQQLFFATHTYNLFVIQHNKSIITNFFFFGTFQYAL